MQVLANTPSRSAFLQSLQRSRERRESGSSGQQVSLDPRQGQQKSSSSFTPRRLSLSPIRAAAAAATASELKPAVNTPSMQSKLASHAFTLSRSSTSSNDDELRTSRDSLLVGRESSSELEALKREIEKDRRRESFYSQSTGHFETPVGKKELSQLPPPSRPEFPSMSQQSTPIQPLQTEPSFSIPGSSRRAPMPSELDTSSYERFRPSQRYQELKSPIDFSKVTAAAGEPESSKPIGIKYHHHHHHQDFRSGASDFNPAEIRSSSDFKSSSSSSPVTESSSRPSAERNEASPNTDALRQIIQAEVSASLSSLRNDMQNLHVELIKQSLAQQATLRSLFETYLPMTGQLMDALASAREENERLKLLLSDLRK